MSQSIRVLSYNIHKGFCARNRNYVLDGIREAVHALAPDVVFLQEVLGEHQGHRSRIPAWPERSQFEHLAGELWPHFAYGRNAVYVDGHHGNAILSRFPILRSENEDISTGRLERRGMLHAVIRPTGTGPDLHLICAHFGLIGRDRRVQARRLCQRIRAQITPGHGMIVAGDFNDWDLRVSPILLGEAGLHEAFQVQHRRHARTFPARMPLLRLDRIYFQGLELSDAHCLVEDPWPRLSDHAPILAVFNFPKIASCGALPEPRDQVPEIITTRVGTPVAKESRHYEKN